VKATVSTRSLGQKLTLADLGSAGAAVALGIGGGTRGYLERSVESRGAAPAELENWISGTLTTAQRFGFLKQQKVFLGGSACTFFEVSHDSLIDIFRAFSLEFEKWISRRIVTFLAVLFGGLFGIPIIVFLIAILGTESVEVIGLGILYIGGYALVAYIFGLIMRFLKDILYFPIVRRLARGTINRKGTR
jgi:hypothetical protein